MVEEKWFVDDPEGAGLEYYGTEEGARLAVDECIAAHRNDAESEGEWGMDVESIRFGKVLEASELTDCPDNDGFDLKMKQVYHGKVNRTN